MNDEYIKRKSLIENLNYFAPECYHPLVNNLILKQEAEDVVPRSDVYRDLDKLHSEIDERIKMLNCLLHKTTGNTEVSIYRTEKKVLQGVRRLIDNLKNKYYTDC